MIQQILKTGYNPERIAEVIRNDDIDAFCQIYSQNPDKFNFNKCIRPSFLERVDLFGIYPSLIHYAAFFNSIKIFKYLVLHQAELNDELNENWLLKCAIAGGSVEVVRFLEQKKINIIKEIHYAIEYCQNDILVWILENQMHSSDHYSEITPDED